MGTYWNNNGKHQEWVEKINDTMPSMYDTDNYYMNVFIAFSNIYYDIYNNGGGNIEDGCYDDSLRMLDNFLGLGNFNWYQAAHDFDYLEDKANEVFEKLIDKLEELKKVIEIKPTIKDYGVDEAYFLETLDEMTEQAFNDQCTGANPRYPLMSELKEIYLKAYYGK